VSGTAFARNAVMNGKYGWKKRCEDAINTGKLDRQGSGEILITKEYFTITECLNDNKEHIEIEMDAWKNSREKINEFGKGAGGEDYEIRDKEWRKKVLQKLKNEYGTKFDDLTGEDTIDKLAEYLSNNDIEELGLYLELEDKSMGRADRELGELKERIGDRKNLDSDN
jgi:hypothetical protein